MRRLNSKRRIKFDTVQELCRLRLWAASLTFPSAPYEGQGYFNWKMPVLQHLVGQEPGHPDIPFLHAGALLWHVVPAIVTLGADVL